MPDATLRLACGHRPRMDVQVALDVIAAGSCYCPRCDKVLAPAARQAPGVTLDMVRSTLAATYPRHTPVT